MAQTHHNAPASEPAPIAFNGDDVPVKISAKDATRGMYAIMPVARLVAALGGTLDEQQVVTYIAGLSYYFTRDMQSVANKAQEEKADVGAAVTAAALAWVPKAKRTADTIQALRLEHLPEVAAAVTNAAKGTAYTGKDFAGNKTLPAFLERNLARVDAAIAAKLAEGYEVAKRGKGGTVASGAAAEIDLSA